MKTLPEVDTAKQLMNEAMKWSVMTWLREKKRVRKTADQANEALDRLSEQLRQRWPEDLRQAYNALSAKSNGGSPKESPPKSAGASAAAQKLKEADDEVFRARKAAEQAFDEAEKRLSTSLAREGCLKAIQAWELHEKAISHAQKCVA